MKKKNQFYKFAKKLGILFLSAGFLAACASDGGDSSDSTTVEKRIAIIVPLNGYEYSKYSHIIEWCKSNFDAVKDKAGVGIDVKMEIYDEAAIDRTNKDWIKKLALDKDISAIIGPFDSSLITEFADICRKYEKPLILPGFSSDDLLRRYSVSVTGSIKRPFLWSLTESDVSQCEVALSKIYSLGYSKVAVISSADSYGNTFYSWAPFLTTELKMTLLDNVRYKYNGYSALKDSIPSQPIELLTAIERVLSSDADVVLCAMRNIASSQEIHEILEAHKSKVSEEEDPPDLFFTDSAFTDAVIIDEEECEGMEGTAPYADPGNGFLASYHAEFGTEPVRLEAQLYDAILFSIYAMSYQYLHPDEFISYQEMSKNENIANNIAMNQALRIIGTTSSPNQMNNSWKKSGIQYTLEQFFLGNIPKMEGASGIISFDAESLTTILYSTYIHWTIVEYDPVMLDYLSPLGSRRTSSTRSAWAWNTTIQDFSDDVDTDLHYSPLDSNYAFLIAASSGWKNYRHQADVLNMYKYLTGNGFDDDHIIMIMQDDIANNKENNDRDENGNPCIRVSPTGENLYTEAAQKGIDGHISDLTPEDIKYILTGDKTSLAANHKEGSGNTVFTDEQINRLVFSTTESSNLFLFWSGHGDKLDKDGTKGHLIMALPTPGNETGYRESGFTTELLGETLSEMEKNKKYRQFLIVNESCYSKSVFNAAEGVKGVLVYGASNGNETSFTDVRNPDLGVWMTNRFTKNFMANISKNFTMSTANYVTYYDIYADVAKKTLGSHVCLINSSKFGHVKQISPVTFLISTKYLTNSYD
ncbi:MAG: caspase family protein [Treponema sp.]|nr:caspase family protein [Treponema sp.]